jgi:hypothetical protein
MRTVAMIKMVIGADDTHRRQRAVDRPLNQIDPNPTIVNAAIHKRVVRYVGRIAQDVGRA